MLAPMNICTIYRYLADYSGSSADEISCATGMRPSTVRSALNRMIEAGFVTREMDTRYTLTDSYGKLTYCEREVQIFSAVRFKETERVAI